MKNTFARQINDLDNRNRGEIVKMKSDLNKYRKKAKKMKAKIRKLESDSDSD